MRVAIATLGCKVNQFDSQAIAEDLRGAQVVAFDESADLYVINTCAVTIRSEAQSRQLVRQAVRRNPRAKVIVTGCYAQLAADALREIEGIDVILGTGEKGEVSQHARDLEKRSGPLVQVGDLSRLRSPLPARAVASLDPPSPQILPHQGGGIKGGGLLRRTRAVLKIQEGCDYACAFCVIPQTRGMSRSVLPGEVVAQAERLVAQGYLEIVLTGVQIGCYGRDLNPQVTLASLLRDLHQVRGLKRLRVSSLDPREVTEEFIEVFTGSSLVCPHLHLPLQSGDAAVLERMARGYTPVAYARTVDQIVRSVPDAAIGTDLIVGFPGEDEAAFQETVRLVEDLPFSYLHVFPYSPRPGVSPGVSIDQLSRREQVDDREKKRRAEQLRLLGARKQEAFRRVYLGRRTTILVEEGGRFNPEWIAGRTGNYLHVQVPRPVTAYPQILEVEIQRLASDGLFGVWTEGNNLSG
jgi:threonylcarbamoyladenosine tRNA methylthiotransferase MtaB